MTLAGRMLRGMRLYRPALWGYWQYRFAQEHVQSLGLVGGLTALFLLRTRSGASGRTLKLQIPGSRSPFFFREGTADAWVFRQIFVQRQYEVEVSSEPHLIIDAGANIGCASVFFACRYPQATILAIEPDAANFEMLSMNAAPYRNIVPIRAAVWGRPEVLAIANPNSKSWEFQTRQASAGDVDTVVGLTIDELLTWAGAPRIDILKIDIEGAEKQVFSGPYDRWLGRVGAIFAELHDRLEPECSETFRLATAPYGFIETQRGEDVILIRAGALS
jgi:FkbM family methyltransferase